jgi:hypothetical protein
MPTCGHRIRSVGPKQPLTKLYNVASLWVYQDYQDFEMKTPERPDRWGSVK